jgi:N-acetylneuraminic acid mutarotase
MRKSAALLLALVFLIASCLMVAKPAFSFTSAAENTWTQKAPMQEARHGLGAAVVDGRIYAIGGFTQKNGIVGTNEEYDPKTDTWSYKAPMPTPRYYFAITVYQNKIYCIGGCVGETKEHGQILTAVNEVYDPATNTWENKTTVPTAKIWATASVVEGKIYVIGGHPNETLCEVYDPGTDSWTTKPPLSTNMFGPSAVYNDKVYVIWGQTRIYDPATGEVSLGASQPIALPSTSEGGKIGVTTGFMAPKRMYVFSGGANQVYDPEADSWAVGASIPTSRGDFAVAVVDDLIYVIGGWATTYVPPLLEMRPFGSGVVTTNYATVEAYAPSGYGTVPPEISIVSPENKTYTSSNVSLAFTVNKPALWVGYSLDSQDNVTITGNTTLSGLTNGSHNITVYAKDEFENTGASETVTFTIAKETEAFPIRLTVAAAVVVAAVVLLAAVGVGLSAYLKKRK